MSNLKRSSLPLIIGVVMLLSFIAGSCITALTATKLDFKTENKEVEAIPGYQDAIRLQEVYRKIATTVSPAVVSIYVESEVTVKSPYDEFFDDPFFQANPQFKEYFGEGGQPTKQVVPGQGSGFIISKNGYLFSNYHVVQGAKLIKVMLSDGREFDAKVIGADPETDVAILKIDAKEDLPYVAIGDSDGTQVGDIVVAIGNPFGLSGTYTTGVISALGRPGMSSGFQSYFQTDTAVNPGNSGGPLVNIHGQVIGINTAIQSQTGGYMGISFAIPINMARSVAVQILDHGKVERGYLGITPMTIDETARKSMKIGIEEGVLVSKVEPNSPAAKSGLKQGDIVLSIESQKINAPDKLQKIIGGFAPGSKINLEILRDGKRQTLVAELAERPSSYVANDDMNSQKNEKSAPGEYNFKGITFVNASAEDLKRNGAESGLLVNRVKRDSQMVSVLQGGEIVSSINGVKVKTIDDVKDFDKKNPDLKSFTFQIYSRGYMFYRGIEQ